ncbi:endonuclease domain-containing protein [Pedobacter mucosus]|uniref:endonuclease domain-containing protein n=1 Tax=Pedobacter mucosus TaxID=2895286 RepID=UPI001EE48B9A|nr:endonuclease domain-containing protein [Pedobacter mucosus]UKT65908.1 endonuclease domain-containing protein [Pedobacter mucosus]
MEKAKKENLWHYNRNLRGFANANRKNMTKAEACIWKFLLSSKQMMGYSFRRQRPILNFIADFMCKELMLIIEVDGLTHDWESIAENDILRGKALSEIGYTIIHFNDDEVLNDMENVNRAICFYIEDFVNGQINQQI